MKHKIQTAPAAGVCDRSHGRGRRSVAPTDATELDAGPERIAIRAAGQARRIADDVWRAVVKSGQRGAYLIRRRQDALADLCPFLCFSVRRVEVARNPARHGYTRHL